MFPEITRDEVFRIETSRLWLRWPVSADAKAFAAIMTQECTDAGSRLVHANTQAMDMLVARWRFDMETGQAMHLALVPKESGQVPIGTIHASPTCPIRLAPEETLGEIGCEAVSALSTMLRLLGFDVPRRNHDRRPMPLGGARQPAPALACFGGTQ